MSTLITTWQHAVYNTTPFPGQRFGVRCGIIQEEGDLPDRGGLQGTGHKAPRAGGSWEDRPPS
eukprot:6448704-Pyramimonas_sp.AAC.1